MTLMDVVKDVYSQQHGDKAPPPPPRPMSSSNAESAGSKASKDEDNVKSLASAFVRESLLALGSQFRHMTWGQQHLEFNLR
jgi:hypothetical protein